MANVGFSKPEIVISQLWIEIQNLYNVKCTKVPQVYQNSLGMMPSVLNTDPIPSVPKYNWCTKRNDCNKRTENDQWRE